VALSRPKASTKLGAFLSPLMAPSRSKSLASRRAFLCPLYLATDCRAAELALPENDPQRSFLSVGIQLFERPLMKLGADAR
jgi:hypothetical protein